MDTTPAKKKTQLPRLAVWVAAAAVVAALAAWVFWPTSVPNMTPLPVQQGELTDTVPVNAILVPVRSGAVATLTGGTVVKVVAYAGQDVKASDPLLELANADLERQLAEALSELAGAKADLVSQQADAADQVNSLHMGEIIAGNALRIAEMQLEAERKLQKQGVISQLSLEKTAAERDAKIAERDYAVQHARQAGRAGLAKANAASERVAVLQARANSLQTAVDGLILKAPFDGIVASIDGNPGAAVTPGVQVAEVITLHMQVNLEVAEQFASQIHPGQPLVLQGGLKGTVQSIAPAADGGVVKGRATIKGDTHALRSNTALPGEAILQSHGKGIYVQVEGVNLAGRTVRATVRTAAGQIERREVHFGPRYGNKIAIEDGAIVGDQIVGLAEDTQ